MRKFIIETIYGCVAIALGIGAITYLSQQQAEPAGDQVVSIVVEDVPIIITTAR